ncbi:MULTISPECIES: SigE family RNA polymerase sigma factor [Nocardioides]|uniref:SigE family RNA polymerase sigma factor n=1 Tax=Nocardioides vastitatis TaxID=2568655 RepID=A0ABW0ZHW3_9ACTN|nr:SigE family RNA polymerase sigma factor [Nocardioides sp.]THI94745.1 SigE family RNA polymerase sigma factor [Nocardioides sp.]
MATRDVAFAAYVVQRRPQLYRAAWLLCGDAHRAEDVVQSALTKLYVAWARVERADSVDAYVRRAIVNAHLDETRRPWRRETAAGQDLPESSVAAVPVEEHDALWTALRSLAPGMRKVVVLRHFWGLSVEETATDLGISAGTVKSQTSAALRALRTVLADNLTKETS